ncbi:MAG: M48 family metallopeptidase [Microcystaceae cyanobacterium]
MDTLTYENLTFELRPSDKRRTVGITVARDGKLQIAYPASVNLEQLYDIIESRKLWIYRKLLHKEAINLDTPRKDYVCGEGFYYLGRSYRLKLVDPIRKQSQLRLHQGRFLLHRTVQQQARDYFIIWYRRRLSEYIKAKMKDLTPHIGLSPNSLQVRDLGNRWGSCSPKGDVYIHWRVALLPRPMIRYVLVHELVHLLESQHNRDFWNYVEGILPDYRQSKQWLAEQGKQYDL